MQRKLAWPFLLVLTACPAEDPSTADTKKTAAAPAPEPSPQEVPATPLEPLRELPLPVSPGSTAPNLHVDDDSRLYLSWLEPMGPEGFALRIASHDGNGWGEAFTVTQNPKMMANWADVPVVGSFADGDIALAWLESHEDTEGYGLRLSRSHDRGQTFANPIVVQGEAIGPEFGFLSFARASGGALNLYWLDSRVMEEGGKMQLRTARLGKEGPLGDSKVLDETVCDCCQTAAIASELGELVVYRDRTDDEVRDIRIAGGKLPAEGAAVSSDAWKITACPVNGPSIAGAGRELAVAWFTGKVAPGRVDVAFTADPAHFGTPIRVDGGHPLGRVDVEMASDGSALVTWMEADPEDATLAQIRVRRVHKDGRMSAPRRVATTGSSRESGFPRAVLIGERMIWVWTDPGLQGISKVRGAEAPLSSIP